MKLLLLLLPIIEAHGTVAWDPGIHGGWGGGAGARVAIPIASAGPGELAFTAGAGWLWFPCPYGSPGAGCPDAHAIWAPLGLVWSFPLHRNVSIFLEPGVGTFIAFFSETCPFEIACTRYDHVGLRPIVALGADLRLGPLHVVARAGFPTFSLGLGL